MKRSHTFLRSLLSALLLTMLFNTTWAQQRISPQDSFSHRVVLLFAAPPPGERYQLRSGDALSVRVFGYPELTSEAIIDERGVISIPFIDAVEAAGHTVGELRSEIVLRYRKFVKNPQVSVRLLEFNRVERAGVYAVYDNLGRELSVYTSVMRAEDGRVKWEVKSLRGGEFRLSFFSDSFFDGAEKYEVEALLDGSQSLRLGTAIKIRPTIVTAHNDPRPEVRLQVPLATLARVAKARDVKMRFGDRSFQVTSNDLEVLRFIVSHFSATAP